MARLWARTTTFDSVNVGDELPILVKWETAETIGRFASLPGAGSPDTPDSAETTEVVPAADTTDARPIAVQLVDPPALDPQAIDFESAAQTAMPESGPAPPQALLSYVTELLEKGFPLSGIMAAGSSLELWSLVPVRAEDTISLSGRVTGKRQSGGFNLVECSIRVENQDGRLVAEATALVSL